MSAVITSLPAQTRSENGEKLLKQLLECVQECQKRYGGKTELATEFDNCVVALCLSIEAVLLHGIKKKESQASTLKQVSEIVVNSLHIKGESPCKLLLFFFFHHFISERYIFKHFGCLSRNI